MESFLRCLKAAGPFIHSDLSNATLLMHSIYSLLAENMLHSQEDKPNQK
jgi:hypothetical protein